MSRHSLLKTSLAAAAVGFGITAAVLSLSTTAPQMAHADLPPASPQVFGDQTDVPESADWWDAAYLVMWGSNVPVTRTPNGS